MAFLEIPALAVDWLQTACPLALAHNDTLEWHCWEVLRISSWQLYSVKTHLSPSLHYYFPRSTISRKRNLGFKVKAVMEWRASVLSPEMLIPELRLLFMCLPRSNNFESQFRSSDQAFSNAPVVFYKPAIPILITLSSTGWRGDFFPSQGQGLYLWVLSFPFLDVLELKDSPPEKNNPAGSGMRSSLQMKLLRSGGSHQPKRVTKSLWLHGDRTSARQDSPSWLFQNQPRLLLSFILSRVPLWMANSLVTSPLLRVVVTELPTPSVCRTVKSDPVPG